MIQYEISKNTYMEVCYETNKDFKYKDFEGYNEKRRMWRMSNIMSIGLQDILHSWKSKLREQQIVYSKMH